MSVYWRNYKKEKQKKKYTNKAKANNEQEENELQQDEPKEKEKSNFQDAVLDGFNIAKTVLSKFLSKPIIMMRASQN